MNWKNLKAPFKALVIIAVFAVSIWADLADSAEDSPRPRSSGRCAALAAALSRPPKFPRSRRRCRRRRARSSTAASTASASPSRRSATSAATASWSSFPAVKNPDRGGEGAQASRGARVQDRALRRRCRRPTPPLQCCCSRTSLAKDKAAAELYVDADGATRRAAPVVYSGKDLKARAGQLRSGGPSRHHSSKRRTRRSSES